MNYLWNRILFVKTCRWKDVFSALWSFTTLLTIFIIFTCSFRMPKYARGSFFAKSPILEFTYCVPFLDLFFTLNDMPSLHFLDDTEKIMHELPKNIILSIEVLDFLVWVWWHYEKLHWFWNSCFIFFHFLDSKSGMSVLSTWRSELNLQWFLTQTNIGPSGLHCPDALQKGCLVGERCILPTGDADACFKNMRLSLCLWRQSIEDPLWHE